MRENLHTALLSLINLSESKEFITFDDVMDCSDKYMLTIQEVDWLSNEIVNHGIIVYDSDPTKTSYVEEQDEVDDFAQVDYEKIYKRVLELDSSLEEFIDYVRDIIPPQYKEVSQLKVQVAEGNKHARKRMIEMYIRVSIRIALQRAEAYDLEIADTIQDGCVGLINAVDKYSPYTSDPFNSYTSYWIFQNITREQATCSPLIYYPVHKKEQFFQIFQEIKNYGCLNCENILNCSKAQEIVCQKLECSRKEAEETILTCVPEESLDYLIENSDEKNEKEFDESYDNINEWIEQYSAEQIVKDLFSVLKPREIKVIKARFGFDDRIEKTLEEVGNIEGVTRERIRQIENKAIKKMKRRLDILKLKFKKMNNSSKTA